MGEVTLTIRCDTVKGLTDARYIPDSAVILPETSYKIAENATVYDVLVQAAKENQLQLDCRGTVSYTHLVSPSYALAMHIDTDESNAGCVAPGTMGEVIK